MMRVFVISPDQALEEFLRRELSAAEYEVVGARSGPAVVQTARGARPEIAVVDRVDARRSAAALEIAILRDIRADVRIIVVSGASSPEDAPLIEGGVFFYMPASPPVRLPEVVRAAARSIRRQSEWQTRQGELR